VFVRGKRRVQLNFDLPDHKAKTLKFARSADVVVQGYRTGSLAARRIDAEQLSEVDPGFVVANLSAFEPYRPWKGRHGYDSLVQTCAGISVSEAERYGDGRLLGLCLARRSIMLLVSAFCGRLRGAVSLGEGLSRGQTCGRVCN
jgi:crotonobetainyl-CoA:carnitine CoA-transferase CaiB-like acyl-CoA transferase